MNYKHIQKMLNNKVSKKIECREWHSSIVLDGEVKNWNEVIKAGKLTANKGYKGVVNKIQVKDLITPKSKSPRVKDSILNNKKVDVLIIGGGVIGCSIARELSKWDISILLIEKEEDLAMHTSSRNDGMVHPGVMPKPGSKKAHFNVKGNELYSKISKELDVSFRRIGSLVLFNKRYIRIFAPIINHRAKQNHVKGVRFISEEKLRKIEPNVSKDIKGALYMPSAGVISPYKVTIAYAENAVQNGAEVALNTIALTMEKENKKIVRVFTNRGVIYPKIIINAAGVNSDKIAEMFNDQFFTIHPRKGEIALLDKKKSNLMDSIIGRPSLKITKSTTKGGGLVKTVEGNILVGPNAFEQPFREDYTTNGKSIDQMLNKHLSIIPKLSKEDVITYFSGIRAATYEEDFIVEKSEYVDNLIHAAGIQSPGLASAPAIALEIERIAIDLLNKLQTINKKINWNAFRKGIPRLNSMNIKERNNLIKKRPDYGMIVCRCEEISKGEIKDAINSPIPINSIDAIKRRTRAGMGRCQGSFCTPLVAKIIEDETGIDLLNVTKKGNGSNIVAKETK